MIRIVKKIIKIKNIKLNKKINYYKIIECIFK